MKHHVAVQRLLLHEALLTLAALIWLLWCVDLHVVLQCALQREGLTTHSALEGPKICVVHIMALEFCTYRVLFGAFVAFKLFICSMRIHVLHKCTLVHKCFLAEVTYKWFLSRVQSVVKVMFLSCFERLITLVAWVSIYRCVNNPDVTHQLFTFRVHFVARLTHERRLRVTFHVEMQTGLGLEARTTLITLKPSLCHVFAFVGGQVAPFPECHATHITRMGIPLHAYIVTRNIITVILIMAFTSIITITIIIILLLQELWLALGLNSCPFQGTQVSGRLPATTHSNVLYSFCLLLTS